MEILIGVCLVIYGTWWVGERRAEIDALRAENRALWIANKEMNEFIEGIFAELAAK